MPQPKPIKNVPESEVGDVLQGFVDGGAAEVKAERQADGKWTVTQVR